MIDLTRLAERHPNLWQAIINAATPPPAPLSPLPNQDGDR